MTNPVLRWFPGDEDAAREMFERYATRLTALAEKQLSRQVARRVDGADVVQSVFRTFFERTARGEFRIDSSIDLWRLLVQITVNKARMQARFHAAERRDVSAESPGGDEVHRILSREPQPDEAVALVDEIDAILTGLPDVYAEILALRLEGRTRSEIAEQLDLSRPTVQRVLGLFQQRLEQVRVDGP